MLVEAAILIGLEELEIERVDILDRGRQPPFAVGGGEGAQQPTVGVDDLRRTVEIARQVRRKELVERQRAGRAGERRDGN